MLFEDIRRNMYDKSSGGSLEGRNLRVVVAMVICAKHLDFVVVVIVVVLVWLF